MGLKEIEKQVQSEINKKRNKALSEADLMLSKFFEDKKAEEIFEKYQTQKIEYSKAVFKKDSIASNNILKSLNSLKTEMQKIIKTKNINPNDLKPKFECSICHDEGKINGQKCECFKRFQSIKLMEASGVGNKLASFEGSDLSVVKDKTQKENLKKIQNLLKTFCDKIDETKYNVVLLSGEVGVGKTYQMECVINELIEKGKFVLYTTAFNMNKKLLECHISDFENKSEILSEFLDCDVLCIDDLGTENITKNVTIEYLFAILNERGINKKKTIITTNLSISQLNDKYGERICSRLVDKNNCLKLEIKGKDLRIS